MAFRELIKRRTEQDTGLTNWVVVHSTFVEITSVYHLPSSRSRRRPHLLPALLVFFIFLSPPPSPSRFPFSPSPRSAALSLVSDSYSFSVFAVASVKWAFVIEPGQKPREPFLHPANRVVARRHLHGCSHSTAWRDYRCLYDAGE